ncbi:MAG: TIGR04076 family protein [Desulfobacterales bacterium]|nr:TIGR04076 family protein [Desulfobacterales bacterium]
MCKCENYEELKKSWGYCKTKKYRFEIEVVEGDKSTCHKIGDKFEYPQDRGLICPWLLDSMTGFIRVLEFGGTLPWKYEGTPYEKEIDPDGVTTEFVRCPDPSDVGIVVKITRTILK